MRTPETRTLSYRGHTHADSLREAMVAVLRELGDPSDRVADSVDTVISPAR